MKFSRKRSDREATARETSPPAYNLAALPFVEQYEELIRGAPPEVLDQIHEEAFQRLSPSQRSAAFDALTQRAPNHVQNPADSTPTELAKAATRIGLQGPGRLAAAFSNSTIGLGVGSATFALFAAYAIGCELSFVYLTAPTSEADALDNPPDYFTDGFGNSDGGLS